MRQRAWNTSLGSAIGLGVLAACSDSTSPRPGRFDAPRVEAGVAAVQRAASSQALGSLQAVARSAAAVGASTVVTAAPQWDGGLADAVQRLATTTANAGAALVPVMRPSVLGKTFVYDATARTYVADPARAGAAPNGVRFILYETTVAGDPIPGREIGYADLTDEGRSSPTAAGVRLVVVTGGITRLSYSFDLAGSLSAAQFTVQGFLSDGTERVEFAITTSQQLLGRGGAATLDATLRVPQHDFVVTAKAQGTAGESNGDAQMSLTIHSGADQIAARVQTGNGQLDASFTVNGQLLATATGDPHAPVIRGEGGRALTEDEMHALGALVAMAGNLFTLIGNLLAPAGALLLIALGLGG